MPAPTLQFRTSSPYQLRLDSEFAPIELPRTPHHFTAYSPLMPAVEAPALFTLKLDLEKFEPWSELTADASINNPIYMNYPVSGNNAAEAIADAFVQGKIRHANGDQLPGETDSRYFIIPKTWLSYRAPVSRGDSWLCKGRVTGIKLKGFIIVDLPQWTKYSKASEDQRQAWEIALQKLRDHEDEHVRIAQLGFQQLLQLIPQLKYVRSEAQGKTKEEACAAADLKLTQKMKQLMEPVLAAIKGVQKDLDHDTKHGAKSSSH